MAVISRLAEGLVPYTPGEQPKSDNLIKLNTNENPYPPAPGVAAAVQEAAARLRLYPDSDATPVREAAAEFFGVGIENIFAGNGSDEVLSVAWQAFFDAKKLPVLFPDITYSFYPVYCALYEIPYETVPLDGAFRINIKDYLRPSGGAIFPNPNAPTAIELDIGDIETLVRYNRDAGNAVIIDEAYAAFSGNTALPLINKYDNLIVITTMSKSHSLAGLRLGIAMGAPKLISAMKAVKDSFNSYPVDMLAQAGGAAALRDRAAFEKNRDAIIGTRESFSRSLKALGFDVLPSAANFVFARHPAFSGEYIAAKLREREIIVRRFNGDRIKDFLRITIGTDREMAAVADALREITAGNE